MRLENRGKAKNPNEHWHSDMSYEPVPPKLTMLHAIEAPELGGETAFANQHLALAELSVILRDQLRTMAAVHSAEGLARLYGQDPAEAPRAVHPVVRRHEDRGDEALYVCRAFTRTFEGWQRNESQEVCSSSCSSTRPAPISRLATAGGPAMSSSGTTARCCTTPSTTMAMQRGPCTGSRSREIVRRAHLADPLPWSGAGPTGC